MPTTALSATSLIFRGEHQRRREFGRSHRLRHPRHLNQGNKVIGLSYDGSSFHKNLDWVPLLRVYWSEQEEEVCLAEVIDVVNENYENTLHTLIDGCATSLITMEAAQAVKVMPNPMSDMSMVQFPLGEWTMDIFDIQGRTVMSKQVSGRRVNLRRADTRSRQLCAQAGERPSHCSCSFEVR